MKGGNDGGRITNDGASRVASQQLDDGSPDLVRQMIKQFAQELMGAEADAICGAGYGERHPDRVNHRNGYRERRFDTRAARSTLRSAASRRLLLPDWLLTPRRRAEQALLCAIADAYLAGSLPPRVDKLVRQLGIDGISKSRCL